MIGKGHNREVDWWAFGVLIFEMAACSTPFEDKKRKPDATLRNILKQAFIFPRGTELSGCSFDDENRRLISALLQKDPSERLGSSFVATGAGSRQQEQVLHHPYFKSLNLEALKSRKLTPPWLPELSGKTDASHFDPSA